MQAPAPARFRKDYIPELDGLRGIAVLLVLWVHLPAGALGLKAAALRSVVLPGNLGVDLFFVLSGFLITRILLVDSGAGVPLRHFLMRRFLRIFPIYYLTIAVLAPLLSAGEIAATATYTSNFAFLFMERHGPLDHTWSLSVEEHFYLLWPPVVAFLSPAVSRRVLLFGVLPVAVLTSLGVMFFGPWAAHPERLLEFELRASPVRFFSLGLGALAAYSESTLRSRPRIALACIAIAATLCLATTERGLAVLGLWQPLLEHFEPAGGIGKRYAGILVLSMPCGSLAAVLTCVAFGGTRWPHGWLLRSRLLRGIGRISYGLYLYHFPIFGSGVWGAEPQLPSTARTVAVLALCFATATLSYFAIERPLLRLGARFRKPATPAGDARPVDSRAASAAVGAP